jgi:hypothetical protein
MTTASRYRNAQKLILGGFIKSVADLFDAVPKTTMARDIHTAPSRLTKLINNPVLFTFDDCYKIAAILEVDADKIIDLIREETRPKKGRRK